MVKHIAEHELVQTKLRPALWAAYAAARLEDRQPSASEISETPIPYLDAVLEEVLRLNSPLGAQIRESTVDTELLGHRIPKGTSVFSKSLFLALIACFVLRRHEKKRTLNPVWWFYMRLLQRDCSYLISSDRDRARFPEPLHTDPRQHTERDFADEILVRKMGPRRHAFVQARAMDEDRQGRPRGVRSSVRPLPLLRAWSQGLLWPEASLPRAEGGARVASVEFQVPPTVW